MKLNIKTIIWLLLALAVGLGAGYFLFSQKTNTGPTITETNEIWTCSMHPQIRQNEPGKCPICGMDLTPLSSGNSTDPLVLKMTPEAVELANIQTYTLGSASNGSKKSIRLSGKIQADERLLSSQVAHVPGRIEQLFVTFTGEPVNKGQKIARIYSPELIAAQGELLEAAKIKTANPKLLEAARNKLRYWRIGEETIKDIESTGQIRETFILYAEASGVVSKQRIRVGDYVKKGDPLFDLMNLTKVWVLLDVYEEDLAQISVGDRIQLSAAAIPNKTFRTEIRFIDPVINPATRIATIRAEIANTNGLLKPEMFVTGVLESKIEHQGQLKLPKSAVLWTGTRSVAYVRIPDTDIPSFQYREVELGERLGDYYQIISGLNAGEEVVINGSFTIDAAAQINNQASMMNKRVLLKNENNDSAQPDFAAATPIEFKQQLAQLTDAYLKLKDALVSSNANKANEAAKHMVQQLALIEINQLPADAHQFWMKQQPILKSHGGQLSTLKDIAQLRQQFDFLSAAMIQSVKAFGVPSDTIYVQYCSMYNNNQGGHWLSTEEAIKNPYYGDAMLTCGVIEDTISN